jgi:tetratricopeptide (TPR) repeat protein
MGYFVRVSGLVLLGLLGVGAVVGRSDMAIGQPVEEKKADDRQSSKAEQLFGQGNQQIHTSQYEAAQQSYTQALKIYRAIGDRNGEADALMSLGNADLLRLQYDKAIGYYQQVLPIYQRVKSRDGEANALMGLGFAYMSRSQYDKAIGYYQKVLPIYQDVKNRDSEADVLRNLGSAYGALSQDEKAIVLYKQSVNVSESIRHGIRQLPQDSQKAYIKSIADTYTYLTKLLKDQGRSTEAEAVLTLLDRVPPNNADGIPLTPAEQKILAEFAK